jgi:AraC-like DNA-binding protein
VALLYHLFLPAKPLQPFIASYWAFRSPTGQPATLVENIFVDGQADLLFNFGCAYTRRHLDSSGKSDLLPASNLDGQRDYPVGIVQEGEIDLVAVRFQPGGLAAFLPMPSFELSNETYDPKRVLGQAAGELENRLYDASADRAAQVRLLDAYFLRCLSIHAPFQFALYLARTIEATHGNLSIQDLSREVGYSIRTVDRLFRESFGLSPKFYARIARFQRVLKLLSVDTGVTLTEVALACCYYDQSHLNKEFLAFAGQRPDQYRAHLLAKAAAPPPNLVQFLHAEE